MAAPEIQERFPGKMLKIPFFLVEKHAFPLDKIKRSSIFQYPWKIETGV